MKTVDYDELKQDLKDNNLKPTAQRLVILECLRTTTSHPTVDEVKKMAEKQLPMISTATVYNVLNQFTGCGLVKSIQVHGEGFQRFDGNMTEHHHFYDEEGQKLIDIPTEFIQIDPKILQKYDVSGIEVILKGTKLPHEPE